jgi:tetratricopeptide (TPR) repeat protein
LPTAIEHYRQGLAHYGKLAFREAIESYRLALAERPEWSDALQALGMAQMHAGDLEPALATLERVTQLAPEDPLGFTSLSMCLQRMNRIADAETAQAKARMLSWKQELKKNPHAPPPSGGMPVQS